MIEIAKQKCKNQDWISPLSDYLEEIERGPFVVTKEMHDKYHEWITDIIGCFSSLALALEIGMPMIEMGTIIRIFETQINNINPLDVGYIDIVKNKSFFNIRPNYQ